MQERSVLQQKRIADLIKKADPIGLIALGAPGDEYQPEASAVAARIDTCKSADDCHVLVCEVFAKYFGASAPPRGSLRSLADEIYHATVEQSRHD